MEHDPQHHPDPEQVADLDQPAWNLPAETVAPVGPITEAWPAAPEVAADDESGEDPAAA